MDATVLPVSHTNQFFVLCQCQAMGEIEAVGALGYKETSLVGLAPRKQLGDLVVADVVDFQTVLDDAGVAISIRNIKALPIHGNGH